VQCFLGFFSTPFKGGETKLYAEIAKKSSFGFLNFSQCKIDQAAKATNEESHHAA